MKATSGWAETEFEAIFREHYERIARVTRRVLHRDSEAEEVCADVFLRLYRSGPVVAEAGTVGGWLYRTATRAAIDVLRAKQRRGIEEDLDCDDEDLSESPLARLLRAERVAEVRAALARMKLERAQILLLRHSGLTYQEIAAAMRMNTTSVGTMLARAEAEFSAFYRQQQLRTRSVQPRLATAKEER